MRCSARLFCQGSPLRSDERLTHALTARTAMRRARLEEHLLFLAAHTPQKKQKTNRKGISHEQSQHVISLWIGRIVATPGALLALEKLDKPQASFLPVTILALGRLGREGRQENARSLEHGFRLLSAYKTWQRKTVGHHRSRPSVTTLLLPSEY